ncbi:polyprenyl synthetase family protein [bacterium]|nr:polyprenyl synthetase family protein [bacterium]MBU1073104.1 polyprenyl synthetase family protein [bacterium]MBU1674647.1 polyprenyl synthetase family protein [bacterium]
MSLLDQERVKLWALQRIIGPELKRFDDVYDELVRGDTPLINEICTHVKQGKSKRFRPTLLLLSAKHDGKVDDAAITAAACVEMIHTATLLHDDFIDEALTRRGLPSVNHHWGPSTALIMGDYLYSKALESLIKVELYDALRLLARTTVLMSQAEMMQIETKYDLSIKMDMYLQIIYRKTASLIESACRIGAGFNPAVRDLAAAFGEFGSKIGFVFQITDDVFDYLGDERRLGKPTGQDWEEGRITLPLIAALASAPAGQGEALLDGAHGLAPEERKDFWPEVKSFVTDHGGVEAARDLARLYGEEAKQALAPVARGVQKDLLAVSVEYVLKRLN